MALVPALIACFGFAVVVALALLEHFRVSALERRFKRATERHLYDMEHLERECALLRARVNVHAAAIGDPSWRKSALNPRQFSKTGSASAASID